jgi:hypothetical protein
MQQIDYGLSDQIARMVTKNPAESFIGVENRTIAIEESEEFAGRAEQ